MKALSFSEKINVILVRPEKPENIGLVARCMKNTGFRNLRVVGEKRLNEKSYLTARHAYDILENAHFFSTLETATEDLQLVLASTSKKRKNFRLYSLDEVIEKLFSFPSVTSIGILFGNERTGLTSRELLCANFCFRIPQASLQPSYNLASSVLLTLFEIFKNSEKYREQPNFEIPLPRKSQEECIHLILEKLGKRGFIHETNRRQMTERIHELLGRLAISEKDRSLLLALFSKLN